MEGFAMDNVEKNNTGKLSSFYLSYEDFQEHFETIKDPRDAALIATIYCGYARVGEIVKGRYRKNPPITKSQIIITDTHMLLNILTEKITKWRKVPTSRYRDGWLHNAITDWMSMCDREELFPYTTRWAQMRFQECFGTQHIHLLRHWACTHALQGKRTKALLHPQYIARLGGWTNFNSFYRTYSHFIVEDFIGQI